MVRDRVAILNNAAKKVVTKKEWWKGCKNVSVCDEDRRMTRVLEDIRVENNKRGWVTAGGGDGGPQRRGWWS